MAKESGGIYSLSVTFVLGSSVVTGTPVHVSVLTRTMRIKNEIALFIVTVFPLTR